MYGETKNLSFVICVEDYHELIQTQVLIQFPLDNLTSENVALLKLPMFVSIPAIKVRVSSYDVQKVQKLF